MDAKSWKTLVVICVVCLFVGAGVAFAIVLPINGTIKRDLKRTGGELADARDALVVARQRVSDLNKLIGESRELAKASLEGLTTAVNEATVVGDSAVRIRKLVGAIRGAVAVLQSLSGLGTDTGFTTIP